MDAVGEEHSPLAAGLAAERHIGHTGGARLVSRGREVIPALGLAWANCVNARLFMSRTSGAAATFPGPPSEPLAAAVAAGWARPASEALPLRKMQVGGRRAMDGWRGRGCSGLRPPLHARACSR